MRFLLLLLAPLLLAACANSGTGSVPPKTVDKVNLERYQGTWYEQARLPMFFQRNCAQSEAHYDLRDDGSIGVLNRCRSPEGGWQEAQGTAVAEVPGKTDKLLVNFDNWFSTLLPGVSKGQYWVLYLDDDYTTAVVGSPDYEYLWLLSRKPEVSAEVRQNLTEVAHGKGYDTSKLIWRTPDSKMPAE